MLKNRPAFRVLSAAIFAVGACAVLLLAGCDANTEGFRTGWRDDVASRLAMPSFMAKRHFAAPPFDLTRFERIHAPGQSAMVYIEGDGFPWMSHGVAALDPTPRNPVALHLATRDKSPNVIYLARPCQYSKTLDPDQPCSLKYWTDARFSPEVIQAMSAELDSIKSQYGLTGFNLVGYSGGGAVAALLAEKRKDILSLRTVAGMMDTAVFTKLHGQKMLNGSLNPATHANLTANIPQHHFIGLQDEIMPTPVYDSFERAAGPSTCMRSSFVDGVDHETGWVSKWPTLLRLPVDCNKTR